MGSPHLSLINMEVYKCGLSNVFKDNHAPHIRIYVYTMQAAADDYIIILHLTLYPIYISLVALVKTMVCSGKNPMKLKK